MALEHIGMHMQHDVNQCHTVTMANTLIIIQIILRTHGEDRYPFDVLTHKLHLYLLM